MFGKLLKYDFRTMLKTMGFVWVAMFVLAIVAHFSMFSSINAASTNYGDLSGVANLSIVLFTSVVMAAFVVTLVFVISRFYKGLLGGEGYLMHTLPVNTWALVGSKLLVAVVTMFCSIAFSIIAVIIMVPNELLGVTLLEMLQNIFATDHLGELLYGCLLLICGLASAFSCVYLSLSVGHLLPKFKLPVAFACFIALNSLTQTAEGLLEVASGPVNTLVDGWLMLGTTSFSSPILPLIFAVVFFAGTCLILQKRLNLE